MISSSWFITGFWCGIILMGIVSLIAVLQSKECDDEEDADPPEFDKTIVPAPTLIGLIQMYKDLGRPCIIGLVPIAMEGADQLIRHPEVQSPDGYEKWEFAVWFRDTPHPGGWFSNHINLMSLGE